jgi:hypothetical protein
MDKSELHKLLTEDDYCKLLGISASKAKQDRVTGKGCRFISIGRCVRYRPSDVQSYLEANVRHNTIRLRK